jgi:hypothetical protein
MLSAPQYLIMSMFKTHGPDEAHRWSNLQSRETGESTTVSWPESDFVQSYWDIIENSIFSVVDSIVPLSMFVNNLGKSRVVLLDIRRKINLRKLLRQNRIVRSADDLLTIKGLYKTFTSNIIQINPKMWEEQSSPVIRLL